MDYTLRIKWGTSRARNTYGYAICSLYVQGVKVASCNGGGYDMVGTVLGTWVERTFASRLLKIKFPKAKQEYRGEQPKQGFYGLTYHDPNWKPSPEIVEKEQKGESLGLERYQDFYRKSSKVPTSKHTIPQIDGACGKDSVRRIMEAIGLELQYIDDDVYKVVDNQEATCQMSIS